MSANTTMNLVYWRSQIQTDLDMEPFVLVHHHQCPCQTPGQRSLAAVQLCQGLQDQVPDSVAECKDLRQMRPVLVLLRDLGVVVAVVGIVNMRVDASLEDGGKVARLDHRDTE